MLTTEVSNSDQGNVEESQSALPIKIFIINLRRAPERWLRVQEMLDAAGVKYERVDAVDGKAEPELCQENTYFPPPLSKWFRPLNLGEIACSLSHRKIWDKMINEQV